MKKFAVLSLLSVLAIVIIAITSCANPFVPDSLSSLPTGLDEGDYTMGRFLDQDPGYEPGDLSADEIQARAVSSTLGIDVSYYQGSIAWSSVYAAGKRFAFARISDGTTYVDSKFSTYWPAMKSAGIIRGAYQFFRPNQDAAAQANLFLSKLGTLASTDMPPVIDVEVTGGMSGTAIVSGVQTWVNIVKSATGRNPIIYTSPSFWAALPSTKANLSNCSLWIAHWGVSNPTVPSPWTTWKFWQYSATGRVSGISGDVDLDCWNGTLDSLKTWISGAAPAPVSYQAPFTRTLSLASPAMTGSDVRLLQTLLNDWAKTAGRTALVVDGSFGSLTQSMVKAYQSAKALVVDGVAGPVTLNSLVVSFTNASSYISPYYRALSLTSPQMSGADVKAFQVAYNAWAVKKGYASLVVDGYYGSLSVAAAKKFQTAETALVGAADGIAGKKTQRLLLIRSWN